MKKRKTQAIEWYCRQVGKGLKCDRKIRNELLNRLKAELYEEGFPETVETAELIRKIGEPEEVSKILLDTLSTEELIQYSRKRIVSVSLIAIALILLLVGVGLILLSGDRGNLVFDRDIPTKGKVYREELGLSVPYEKQYRNKLRKAWGMPDLSRPDYDCWTYKDAHIIADYSKTGKTDSGFVRLSRTTQINGLEVQEVSNGLYRCRLTKSEEPVFYEFVMTDVLLRQPLSLVRKDVISLEVDLRSQTSAFDQDGQEILTNPRIFSVQTNSSVSGSQEETIVIEDRRAQSQEALAAGIAGLIIGLHLLIAYGIYRLMTYSGYRKTWLAWIPFFNLTAASEALKSSKVRKDSTGIDSEEKNSSGVSDTKEFDENGLLGYITTVAICDRR